MKIVLLLLCLWSTAGFSQNDGLKNYYTAINKAELFIIEDQLDSSSFYFKQAFSLNSKPFARHVYNASIV